LRALPFIREKKLSIDSTPIRVGGARLAGARFNPEIADEQRRTFFSFFT
jgi:hypothetical protein